MEQAEEEFWELQQEIQQPAEIGEQNNIASKHPEIVRELLAIMEKEHVENPDFPFRDGLDNNY